jgi:hypothetical protein
MPSQLHESHLFLFRSQPTLAADLVHRAFGVVLPPYAEARVASGDLTEVMPQEYRADMVIELWTDSPVYGLVVEVQLSQNDRKRFAWPAYVANLRARLKCPVALLVVTANDAVAKWAARSVSIGGLNQFTPYVLGPSAIPAITDEAEARQNPELAVLSAMAHGRDADWDRALAIAVAAQKASASLDTDRARLYFDLISSSLGEAARLALNKMDLRKYEFQSDFARHYIALGKSEGVAEGLAEGLAEGKAHGRAELIFRLLTCRFGAPDARAQARIQRASIAELDAIGERLLTARTLQEALGSD